MTAGATQSYLPQLSLAERDRRHAAVRFLMDEQGMDVLLAPANSGRWDPETGGRLTVGDTVCVTRDGARRLTSRSMELPVVDG